MARVQLRGDSPNVYLEAYVPQGFRGPQPVLWLLHGAEGKAGDWLERTRVEALAQEKGLIVACPEVGPYCFYLNARGGTPWENIVTEQLWELLHTALPSSRRPQDNIIAGFSMGGYGALRLGLAHPERYGRIGCISGGVEVPQKYAAGEFFPAQAWHTQDYFGPAGQVLGGPDDLYHLALERAGQGTLPLVYMCCGNRDEHEAQTNPRFRNYLRSLGYDVSWSEGDYGHEWAFCDLEVEKILNWLP